MNILNEQERNAIEDACEMVIGKPAFDAIEKAVIAKLAGAEVPEATLRMNEGHPLDERAYFDLDQLQQFGASCAAQMLSKEPVAWYLPEEGSDSLFRDHSTIVACTGNEWAGWIPLYTKGAA